MTSLSPVWGREVLTTPRPHANWSTRPQSPPRMGTLKVGTMNPGVSQQVFLLQPFCGGSGGLPQPGMPAQAALGSPHLMQAVWLHAGGESAAETVNVVWMPVGKGNAKPSAVAQGVW